MYCHAVSTAEGVYNVSQALRLLQRQRGVAAVKHESKPETPSAASAVAAQQQWCLQWLYLTALLQLGMLHLLAGIAEDAMLCLQQGRNLVRLPAANQSHVVLSDCYQPSRRCCLAQPLHLLLIYTGEMLSRLVRRQLLAYHCRQ